MSSTGKLTVLLLALIQGGLCAVMPYLYFFDSRCPPVSGYGKCAQECSDNAQCVAGKICCSNGCGTYCHQLSFRDRRCPVVSPPEVPPIELICPAVAPECYSDSDCDIGEICCGSSDGCTTICVSIHSDPRCPPVNPPTSPFEQICPAVEPECYNDGDCNAGKICCSSSNGCTTNCVPVLVTDPRCPSNDNVVGPCINLCMSNKQCEGNRICCKVGCGTQCRDVSSVQDARCPPPDPDIIAKLPFLTCTTSTCVDNSQCPTGQICCSDGCSNKCLNIPTTGGSYDDRCPLSVAPVSQIECVHQCSSNSDCKSNYMCCGLYCGSKCVPKPTQPCDPGELMAPCRNTCEELQLTCPNKPSAQCWIYGCNGCKTEFYDENNVIVDCGQ